MSDFQSTDFFTDTSLLADPHPYFDYLREKARWSDCRTTTSSR